MHFTKTKPSLALTLCLLLTAGAATLFAEPRPAMPPAPESHLLLLRFDTVAELTATNKTPLALEGVTSSESFSGYSLHVGGDKPARISFPEINASGKANISFNRGAVRFWFKPDWSGESAGGQGPGTDARLLSLTGGETKAGVNERALLFDPPAPRFTFPT